MRTGANFARGSCRALKWTALVAMVLVLGAGLAAAQAKPLAPTDVTVQGASSTSVTLKWKRPAGSPTITGYQYQSAEVSVAWTDDSPTPEDESTLMATIESLTAGTSYKFRVRSVGPGGNSPWQTSTPSTFAPEETPAAPLSVTVTTGNEMATLVWAAAATGGTPRHYQYAFKPGDDSSTFGTADANKWKTVPGRAGARRVQITAGLTNGTRYVFGVRAVNNGGASTAGTDVGIPSTVPGMPTDLTATEGTPANGKVTVTLAWVAPDDGGNPITGYEYRVVSDSKGWQTIGMVTSFHEVTGLDANMVDQYTYEVRAVNDNGVGPVASTAPMTGVSPTGVTRKSDMDINAAVRAAQMAADSNGDGRWTPEDDPAIVPLAALFNGLPEMFDAEAMSSTAHVQASILASSGLMRASNPAVALRPVSAGMANVSVTAAGVSAPLSDVTVASAPTGTGSGSIRYITRVSVPGSQIREGGQAQATVYLNAPVRQGSIFKAHLRLVGQMHTRERGIVTPLASPYPYRIVGGVRVRLTGELMANDWDADVIGELAILPGYSSGTVTIRTGTDRDTENERLALQAVKDGQMFTPNSDVSPHGGRGEAVFTVEDVHERSYELTAAPSTIYESGNFATSSTLRFTSNFVREDEGASVKLTSSHPAYSALFTYSSGGTGNAAGLPRDGHVTAEFQLIRSRREGGACVCDGDRMDNKVTITATVTANGVEEEVAETEVTVLDVHKLPKITVTAMTVSGVGPLMQLAEGAKYKVRVEADRNDPSGEVTGETVTVSLALGDDSTAVAEDYRITPSSRRITGGLNDQSATFDLEVLGGDGDIGEEMLVLDAMVKGAATHGGGTENKGMLSVTLVDTTTLNVEPRSDTEVELAVVKARNAAEGADDLWTYGDDDLSIKLGDLFKLPADGFTVTADAVSADAKVVTAQADAGMVTVTAVGMGTTMVTVTATTAASGVQISPDIASVEFEVEVDELTRVFMVSGPDDMMNLVEGGEGAMVTVSTNIPVSDNTEVMLMRDGSSSAGDDDYMLEPSLVTIMAGEMTGSTMVTATEDNMAEEMEMLTLFLVVDDMQMTDKSVSFYLWDAAVPALPVIAQLLLAAFLAIGGCRRYLRR